jgi:hypothetical protein
MSLIKNIFIAISLFICVIYIFITRDYYNYCQYATYFKNDNDVDLEKREIYLNFCNDVFKDYSKHSILKFSFGFFYPDISKNVKIDERELLTYKIFLKEMNSYSVRMEFRILQIVHFIYYILILYTFFVSFARILLNIIMYLIDKILILLFFIMIVEGIIIMFLGLDLDIIKIIKLSINFLPFNFVGGIIFSVYEYIAKILIIRE